MFSVRVFPLRDEGVPEKERERLFVTKLRVCQRVYDFTNSDSQVENKLEKRACLLDILQYISTRRRVFTEAVYGPLFDMFTKNLFRALPIGNSKDVYYDQEEDAPFLEPAWPHLQHVYEILRRFIISSETDPAIVRARIDSRFVLSMIELFNSEDPREREYLKTILHRIYGKIMQPRPFIRRSIMNVFHRFVFETNRHNGIAELLEIMGSIINGFAIPLKEEHKQSLRAFLIPLHVPQSLPLYHVQLSFCITQFVEKDPSLASEVISGIIRHWPITSPRKENMLLNELEELIELTTPDDLESVVDLLFGRIAKCIESPHFQVAERAHYLWNSAPFVNLVAYFREKVFRIVFGPLHRNVHTHWSPHILSLSYNVQKLLAELDGVLYDSSREDYFRKIDDAERQQRYRDRKWQALSSLAQKNKETLAESANVPRNQVRNRDFADSCQAADESGKALERETCTNCRKLPQYQPNSRGLGKSSSPSTFNTGSVDVLGSRNSDFPITHGHSVQMGPNSLMHFGAKQGASPNESGSLIASFVT